MLTRLNPDAVRSPQGLEGLWRLYGRIGHGQINNVNKPKHRMLIFCQLYSFLKRQIGSIASVDRCQNAFVHFRRLSSPHPRWPTQDECNVNNQATPFFLLIWIKAPTPNSGRKTALHTLPRNFERCLLRMQRVRRCWVARVCAKFKKHSSLRRRALDCDVVTFVNKASLHCLGLEPRLIGRKIVWLTAHGRLHWRGRAAMSGAARRAGPGRDLCGPGWRREDPPSSFR